MRPLADEVPALGFRLVKRNYLKMDKVLTLKPSVTLDCLAYLAFFYASKRLNEKVNAEEFVHV